MKTKEQEFALMGLHEMEQAQLHEVEGGSLLGEIVKEIAKELIQEFIDGLFPKGPQC